MRLPHNRKPHFEVHPSVVYQLGESLISDSVQAIIELVKNCYDADATYAKVIIDTENISNSPERLFSEEGGRIIVEDDGNGMTLDEIESGWLTISNRKKREVKEARKTTPGGRTPLGDKGLGRLGVQRLGENIEIFTKSKKEAGYRFGFSWLDFETAPNLQSVDVHLDTIDSLKKKGTKIVISKLYEIETWKGQLSIKRLEQELSRMISPYKQIRDFTVIVEIDGKSLELLEISDKVRSIAPIRYDIRYDGNKLNVNGKARLDFFRPSSSKEVELFALVAESDNGKAFYNFMKSNNIAETIKLSQSNTKNWYVEFSWLIFLDDIDKIERDQERDNIIFDPGPFTGEVDSFNLASEAFKQQTVFDRMSEYRDHIKELSGIRVYRDGFAIRVDHDWLKLGAQWTSAKSYYGLKPENTLGYIALTARDNMDLEETTDREGFKDSPYYRNFYRLLEEFKRFSTITHDFFGRSWVEFRKKRQESLSEVDSRKTVEDISRTIKTTLFGANQHYKNLNTFKSRLENNMREARSVALKLSSSEVVSPKLRQEVTETLASLEPLLTAAQNEIEKLSGYLKNIDSVKDLGQIIEDRVDGLRQQMDDMYQTVALGLTAEALSHEVFNIADQLAERTKSAQTKLRNKGITDRIILTFIEYVYSSVLALRKQISFLSPSLRYVRDQKESIKVYDYLNEISELYKDRLIKNNISINTLSTTEEALVIKMNKGKLTQIIDNFVLNSEYWLKEDIAQKRCKNGIITFNITYPFLQIYDNGRGIDPTVEHALFEPFISAKAKGQGRGLGLFIVKQLLDSESCSVGILPERNKHRRLYKFQIDLRGAIHE